MEKGKDTLLTIVQISELTTDPISWANEGLQESLELGLDLKRLPKSQGSILEEWRLWRADVQNAVALVLCKNPAFPLL